MAVTSTSETMSEATRVVPPTLGPAPPEVPAPSPPGAAAPPDPAATRAALRRRLNRIELPALALAVLATFLLTPGLAWAPQSGALMGYAAAVLLGQGLLRDLLRLALAGRSSAPRRRIPCLCAESTMGLGLLLVGLLVLGLGLGGPVALGQPSLTAGLAAVLALGFVAKDYVIVIRREEDHGSIAVW